MINIKNILMLFLTVLMVGSCTMDFREINTNNNSPIDVQPSFLLRNVIWDYNENMSYEGFVSGGLLSQHFTAVDFNLFDRHSLLEPQFGGNPWPFIYRNLRNNEIILDKALANPTFAVYEGPARILKAYMAAELTDIFGKVPYSEALNGKEGNLTPAYDKQEDIYLAVGGIIDNLKKAKAAIDSYQGSIPLEGDIIYGGELAKWRKLANSLLIKAYIRISAIEDVGNNIQDIVDEGDFIELAVDNATFDFTNGEPNNFRLATARAGDFNIYVMSLTSEEILKGYVDPRATRFFRPTGNSTSAYKGLLNGPDASETTISIADYSLAGSIFRENTGDLDANIMTSWETNLLLAEATIKGYITGDAAEYYNTGVEQSFAYWGVEMPVIYLTTGPAAFTEMDAIEKIITQKWISSYVKGFEGWIEYRRTGFPALKTVAASLNDDLIPVKMPYPTDEAALNSESFNDATLLMGGNSINSPVWWDVD